jgi:hypothetical protein
MLSSGRGILMMQAFLHDVKYELGGRRVILTLQKGAGAERRQEAREPVQERVKVTPIAADGSVQWQSSYEAVSRNISPEGIAILQSRLAATDRILVAFDADGRMLYVPAEVRHCRTLAGNVVELGCRLQPEQTPRQEPPNARSATDLANAIETIIGRHTNSLEGDERRRHARVAYTARIGILERSGVEVGHGFARDLSKGGMAFISPVPLALAKTILSLPRGGGDGALYVRASIIRCTKIISGFYDVGARFVSLEPEPDLLVSA